MASPTPREQEFLELVNRMRMNPNAELGLLLNSADLDVQSAIKDFNVNKTTLTNQWASLKIVAPLAWSNKLNESAKSHNAVMIQYDQQEHQVGKIDANGNVIKALDLDKDGQPIPGQYHVVTPYESDFAGRVSATGYLYNGGRENIYSYAKSIVHAHASFAIDWGNDVNSIDGIQNPAGHRIAIMANDVREVGISVTDELDNKTTVGPLVVTQNFSKRDAINGKAWLLGVAFQDKNQDTWYEAGEGLKDISVKNHWNQWY